MDLPTVLFRQRRQQVVAFALMVAFQMIMRRELGQAALQRTFTQQNQLGQALLFHGSNPALRIRVQIRALGRSVPLSFESKTERTCPKLR